MPNNTVTRREISGIFQISQTTLWRYRQDPRFPKPLREGERPLRFRLSDVAVAIQQIRDDRRWSAKSAVLESVSSTPPAITETELPAGLSHLVPIRVRAMDIVARWMQALLLPKH